MGLTDPQQSELRVLDRAKYGGHFVPLYEIEFNFYGNLIMLNKNLKFFDELIVIDTSKSLSHDILIHIRNSQVLFFNPLEKLPFWFTRFLPNLVGIIDRHIKDCK